jgi:nickel-dependent lactate racemase
VFDLDLPSRTGVRVIGDSYLAPLDNLQKKLKEALDKPVGARPLREILPRSGDISILISDLTRGGSAGKILGLLLEFIEERGAGPDRVSIVLALGMHRGHSESELRDHLGSGILQRWKIIEHDAHDRLSLTNVGTTPAGTRCLFNTRVAESALVIALGTVSFHYFAGFGGARKLIVPGVAGEQTILANHRLSLKKDPGEGLSEGCRPGILDGNPVHEDMLAGARLLDARLFAINSIPDNEGNTLFLNAGDLDAAHRAACDFLSANFRLPIDRLYHAVIISAGGYPKDMNLLQSHKALRHATYALEDGGLMLAAAACSEGIGSDSYFAAFDNGRHAVPDSVRRSYTLNAQTALSTYELTGRFSIYLRSMMPEGIVSRFGFCPWREHFEDYLLEGIADEDILFIANASQFLPWRK